MKDCVLVASLGQSPGVVTTAMDALWSEGYRPVTVHCLALPGDSGQMQQPGDSAPLFRDDSASEHGPQVAPAARRLYQAALGYGNLGGKKWYDWQPTIKWWVLNINSNDLTSDKDSFRFFQGCMEVLTQVQSEINESSGELEGWLSLAGGRKSMSALIHTAAFFCGPSLRLCHVTVSREYNDLDVERHWHPPASERTFIELPNMADMLGVLPPEAMEAVARRREDLLQSFGAAPAPSSIRELMTRLRDNQLAR